MTIPSPCSQSAWESLTNTGDIGWSANDPPLSYHCSRRRAGKFLLLTVAGMLEVNTLLLLVKHIVVTEAVKATESQLQSRARRRGSHQSLCESSMGGRSALSYHDCIVCASPWTLFPTYVLLWTWLKTNSKKECFSNCWQDQFTTREEETLATRGSEVPKSKKNIINLVSASTSIRYFREAKTSLIIKVAQTSIKTHLVNSFQTEGDCNVLTVTYSRGYTNFFLHLVWSRAQTTQTYYGDGRITLSVHDENGSWFMHKDCGISLQIDKLALLNFRVVNSIPCAAQLHHFKQRVKKFHHWKLFLNNVVGFSKSEKIYRTIVQFVISLWHLSSISVLLWRHIFWRFCTVSRIQGWSHRVDALEHCM